MKKALSLILALLMIATLIAGCAGESEEPSATPPASTAVTKEPAEENPSVSQELNAVKLPLTTEPISFKMWTGNGTTFDGFADYYDNEVFKEMERLTGVKMDFIHPITGSENENFQLLIASQDLPDFIHRAYTYYLGGMDKAIADQVILSLNDLAAKHMPNYTNRLAVNETMQIQAVSDTGNLWGVHHIVDMPQGSWAGLGIRQDWLDDAGLATPKYIDDMTNVLQVFKDRYTLNGNGPLHLSGCGLGMSYAIMNSFNNTGKYYLNVDGVVKYSPMEQGFKDYLMLLNSWYSKGLIDEESVTTYEIFVTAEDAINGKVGVFDHVKSQTNVWADAAVEENYRVVAIPPMLPEGKDYSDIHVRQSQSWVRPGNSMVITTDCEHPEIAAQYWDYFFTDEGIELANWGPEGLSRTYDAEGNPIYNDDVMAIGNITYVQTKYALHNMPVFTKWRREEQGLNEDQNNAWRIWGQNDDTYVMPDSITLTDEEGAEHSAIKATMDTFVAENITHFITGMKSFDEYDEFLSTLSSLGVDRAIELQQTALDRYYNRLNLINN
jgi:putative aldouronate transport system substrate-binding protein